MLHIDIEGAWEPEDFIEVLKGIESLYYKAALGPQFIYEPDFFWFRRREFSASFNEEMNYANEWLLARSRSIASGEIRLRVDRIEYASPGGLDLAGIGKATEAVKGIIDSLIKFFTEREIRRQADAQAKIETQIKGVELEKERESLRGLKIENAKAILELFRDHPHVPEDHLIALIGHDQDKLIPRIAEKKLVAARRSDGRKRPR